MLTVVKGSLTILVHPKGGKQSGEETLIRTLPTTSLQMFYKIILKFHVIVKTIIDPYDNFSKNSLALMGVENDMIWSPLDVLIVVS